MPIIENFFDIESLKSKRNEVDLPHLLSLSSNDDSETRYKSTIIFIHGLGGSEVDTWFNEDTEFFLPIHLQHTFSEAKVLSLGYENSSSSWVGNAMSLYDRATNIIKLLEVSDIPDGDITLIGHSFGGLLIKSIICGIHSYEPNDSSARSILNNIKNVCFVATPHQGSKLATFAKSLSLIYNSSASTNDLSWGDEDLKKLNTQYKTVSTDKGIKHLSFSEDRTFKKIKIVDSDSADIGLPGSRTVPIDANHIDIAKPKSKDSLLSKSIESFIKK
jgi:triacylglycerol esterase/lipase EstA (alpha/beta hydrolase family)